MPKLNFYDTDAVKAFTLDVDRAVADALDILKGGKAE